MSRTSWKRSARANGEAREAREARERVNKYAHLAPPKREPPRLVRMHANKVRWRTLDEALQARGAREAEQDAPEHAWGAYYCPLCAGYHIGHARQPAVAASDGGADGGADGERGAE